MMETETVGALNRIALALEAGNERAAAHHAREVELMEEAIYLQRRNADALRQQEATNRVLSRLVGKEMAGTGE